MTKWNKLDEYASEIEAYENVLNEKWNKEEISEGLKWKKLSPNEYEAVGKKVIFYAMKKGGIYSLLVLDKKGKGDDDPIDWLDADSIEDAKAQAEKYKE